jgi:hypothetical protein
MDQDVYRARLCNAIIDRLTFKGFFIDTGTESYRLKATLKDQQQ